MNTSLVTSKFLSHPEDIGVVAVGFSGGQVRTSLSDIYS
jgi:arginase